MVFYFSGTGNSFLVARKIAEVTNEKLINIAEAWKKKEFEYELKTGERIGIVYPIHAWAPPTIVKRFIKKLKLHNMDHPYTYSVLTCGDDYEGAAEHIRHSFKKIGLPLKGDFHIIMPNNYVIGHELDTEELVHDKLASSNQKIEMIAEGVLEKRENYVKTKYSIVKSWFVYLFFQGSKIKPMFSANSDCIGCGLCEKACPMDVITMKEKNGGKKPSWGSKCIQCNACINVCPKYAINYLGITKKRRRYFNSEYKKEIATHGLKSSAKQG